MALASDQITIDQLPLAVEISGNDVMPGIVSGSDAGVSANTIKRFVLRDMGIPGNPVPVDTDGYISNRFLNPIISKDFVRQTVAEMLEIADADEGDTCYVLDESVYYKLFQTPATDINNWKIISDPFTVRSVFGRPGPNIEAQHGDYTTDLVPEGEDPLRKYFTQNRFDDAFALRFPIAFENILVDYRNQPNGVAGLDHLKVVEAADFRLSQDPTQTLKNIYDNANQPDWFVKLNSSGKIDSQYLPPSPSGYTDNDARNALAAPDFDKVLGFKNKNIPIASMIDNTANLAIDANGDEYLQHKVAGTARRRRFAMQATDVVFSGAGINLNDTRRGKLQVNNYATNLNSLTYTNNIPFLINAPSPNWNGSSTVPGQDVFSILIPGVGGQTYGSVVRFRAGAYYRNGLSTRTQFDICTSGDGVPTDNSTRSNVSLRLTPEAAAFRVKTDGTPPDDLTLFYESIAFYTDSAQKFYLSRLKKAGGAVVDASPILVTESNASGLPNLSSVPNNTMTFYRPYKKSTTRFAAYCKAELGDLFPLGAVVFAEPGRTADPTNDMAGFPIKALDFELIGANPVARTIAARYKKSESEVFDVGFATLLGTNGNYGPIAGQINFRVEPYQGSWALKAYVTSPDGGTTPNTTYNLAVAQ